MPSGLRFAICAGWLLLGVLAGAPARAGTRIEIACPPVRPCPVDGKLLLYGSGETVQLPVEKGVVELNDAPVADAEAELIAPGYWSVKQPLNALPAGGLEFTVWPAVMTRGRFSESAGDVPASFRIEIWQSVDQRKASASVECPVNADRTWTCTLPAMRGDMVLRAGGFVPHYILDPKLEGANSFDAGTMTLRRGASFTAWLDRNSVGVLKTAARARLFPMAADDGSPAAARLRQPVAEGTFNARGMVQLAPVPAGQYTLEVVAPGFATARVHHVEVFAGNESALRRVITLERPVTVEVTLDPPKSPEGKPWRIELSRADDFSGRSIRVGSGVSDNEGRYEAAGQSPGRYILTVFDDRDNRFANQSFDVIGTADSAQTIRLDLIRVHGKVRLSRKPIAAALLFGGRSGKERVRAKSNEDGFFESYLPRAGRWNVDVTSDVLAVAAATEVEVDGADEVIIDLPDTEISGWVVDSVGQRSPDATVTLFAKAGVVTRKVDADGAFRFRGASAGSLTLSADDPATREQSAIVTVNVADGGQVRDVALVLQRLVTLTGAVTSGARPLPGARVIGYGFGQGPARRQATVSDVDGSFRLSFAEGVTNVVLLIAAAGRTFQAFSVAPAGKDVHLDLAPTGGTLRLHVPPNTSRPNIRYQGAVIPLSDAVQWARAQGALSESGRIELPAMAPGSYRFCLTPAGGPETCRDGQLAPGATLTLAPE